MTSCVSSGKRKGHTQLSISLDVSMNQRESVATDLALLFGVRIQGKLRALVPRRAGCLKGYYPLTQVLQGGQRIFGSGHACN
jgi:hypothetical protein